MRAHADSAWIPDYQKLDVKMGLEFFKSSENFDINGQTAPLTFKGQNVQLSETMFWLQPEYGIAQDASVLLKLVYIQNALDSDPGGNTLLSGAGLRELRAGIKWNVKPSFPMLTIEATSKIPGNSPTPTNPNADLVVGDGNFDFNLVLHSAHHIGIFYFALSPGLAARFGPYSLAATLEAFGELRWTRGYFRAFADTIFSFSDEKGYDTASDVHNAPGSGGSFRLLAPNPSGLTAGVKIGVPVYKTMVLEAVAAHSIFGTKYPSFLQFGFAVQYTFDFFKPEVPKKRKRTEDDEPPPDSID